MRQCKSKQPPGTHKLCMSMLSSYFACAVYIFQDSPPQLHVQTLLLESFFPENREKVGENPHPQIIHGKSKAGKGASKAWRLWVKEDHVVKDEVAGTLWDAVLALWKGSSPHPSFLGWIPLSLLPFRHSKQNICVETAATSSLLLPHKRHWGKNKAVFYWHSLGLASPCVGATLSFMTAVGWHKCSHRTGMSSVQDWCSCPLTPDADAEPSGRCHTCTPVPKVGKKISMGRERWTVAVVYSRLPWGEGGCWGPGAISMPHSAPQLRLSTKPGDEGASLWTSEINQPWNIPMLIAPLRDSIQRNTALLCFITWGACAARWLFINF